jgi:hypothetical protein
MVVLRIMSTQAQTAWGPGNRHRETPVAPHATFWQCVSPRWHRITLAEYARDGLLELQPPLWLVCA